VIDFTSGFHQCPLDPASTEYTAFMTWNGLYKFVRMPFGIKGAPSHYQSCIQEVLRNLVHIMCLVYIDDVATGGKTEDEFVGNLKTLFQRFRDHKITVNPKKCKFGMNKVKYCGKVIHRLGQYFDKAQRDKVANFPEPVTIKNLESFNGLVNYFRDHVKDHSTIVKPLMEMLKAAKKTGRKLVWTEEGREAYKTIKQRIDALQGLFFMKSGVTPKLAVDASDYGVGGYLYQIVNGEEQPILYLSKLLDETQRKWHTGEKEAYAMVWALRCLRYELGNRKFILQTDHKNLLYINTYPSPKVNRWKMEVGEYDFLLEYIKGKENTVADGLSRLMDDEEKYKDEKRTEETKAERRSKKLIDKKLESKAKHNAKLAMLTRSKSMKQAASVDPPNSRMEGPQGRQTHQDCSIAEEPVAKIGNVLPRAEESGIKKTKSSEKKEWDGRGLANKSVGASDPAPLDMAKVGPSRECPSGHSAAKRKREDNDVSNIQYDSSGPSRGVKGLAEDTAEKNTLEWEAIGREQEDREGWKPPFNLTQQPRANPRGRSREESKKSRDVVQHSCEVSERIRGDKINWSEKPIEPGKRGPTSRLARNRDFRESDQRKLLEGQALRMSKLDTQRHRDRTNSGEKTQTNGVPKKITRLGLEDISSGQDAHVEVNMHSGEDRRHSEPARDISEMKPH
jgi:hypothetical protein